MGARVDPAAERAADERPSPGAGIASRSPASANSLVGFENASAALLTIRLLGGFQIAVGGQPVTGMNQARLQELPEQERIAEVEGRPAEPGEAPRRKRRPRRRRKRPAAP